MTQDADAGGRWHYVPAGFIDFCCCTDGQHSPDKWLDLGSLIALEARLAAAETARREAEQALEAEFRAHSRASIDNANNLQRAEEAEQERDRLLEVKDAKAYRMAVDILVARAAAAEALAEDGYQVALLLSSQTLPNDDDRDVANELIAKYEARLTPQKPGAQ